jgi:hypothetical protein
MGACAVFGGYARDVTNNLLIKHSPVTLRIGRYRLKFDVGIIVVFRDHER